MNTMISTTGRTRLGAVATPLRAGAPGVVVARLGGVRGSVAPCTTGGELFGSAHLPLGHVVVIDGAAVVIDGMPTNAPKTEAQLRASVRQRQDL